MRGATVVALLLAGLASTCCAVSLSSATEKRVEIKIPVKLTLPPMSEGSPPMQADVSVQATVVITTAQFDGPVKLQMDGTDVDLNQINSGWSRDIPQGIMMFPYRVVRGNTDLPVTVSCGGTLTATGNACLPVIVPTNWLWALPQTTSDEEIAKYLADYAGVMSEQAICINTMMGSQGEDGNGGSGGSRRQTDDCSKWGFNSTYVPAAVPIDAAAINNSVLTFVQIYPKLSSPVVDDGASFEEAMEKAFEFMFTVTATSMAFPPPPPDGNPMDLIGEGGICMVPPSDQNNDNNDNNDNTGNSGNNGNSSLADGNSTETGGNSNINGTRRGATEPFDLGKLQALLEERVMREHALSKHQKRAQNDLTKAASIDEKRFPQFGGLTARSLIDLGKKMGGSMGGLLNRRQSSNGDDSFQSPYPEPMPCTATKTLAVSTEGPLVGTGRMVIVGAIDGSAVTGGPVAIQDLTPAPLTCGQAMAAEMMMRDQMEGGGENATTGARRDALQTNGARRQTSGAGAGEGEGVPASYIVKPSAEKICMDTYMPLLVGGGPAPSMTQVMDVRECKMPDPNDPCCDIYSMMGGGNPNVCCAASDAEVPSSAFSISAAGAKATCPNAPDNTVDLAPFMEWTQILEAVEHPIYGCEAQKKTTVSVQKPIPSSYESGIVMARYGARREHGAIVQRMASSCMQKIKNLAMMEGKMMGPEAWQEALECVFDELDGKDLSALLDSFNVPVNSTRSQAFDMVSASVMQRYMVEDCTGEFKQVCAISTAVKTAEECNFSNPVNMFINPDRLEDMMREGVPDSSDAERKYMEVMSNVVGVVRSASSAGDCDALNGQNVGTFTWINFTLDRLNDAAVMKWKAGMDSNMTSANDVIYMGENGMCITTDCSALNMLNANQDCAHLSADGMMVGNSGVDVSLFATVWDNASRTCNTLVHPQNFWRVLPFYPTTYTVATSSDSTYSLTSATCTAFAKMYEPLAATAATAPGFSPRFWGSLTGDLIGTHNVYDPTPVTMMIQHLGSSGFFAQGGGWGGSVSSSDEMLNAIKDPVFNVSSPGSRDYCEAKTGCSVDFGYSSMGSGSGLGSGSAPGSSSCPTELGSVCAMCTGDDCTYFPPVYSCLIPSGAGNSAINSDETCVALGGIPVENLGCVDSYEVAARMMTLSMMNGVGAGGPGGSGYGGPGGSGYGGPGGSGYSGPGGNSSGGAGGPGGSGYSGPGGNSSGGAGGPGAGPGSGSGSGSMMNLADMCMSVVMPSVETGVQVVEAACIIPMFNPGVDACTAAGGIFNPSAVAMGARQIQQAMGAPGGNSSETNSTQSSPAPSPPGNGTRRQADAGVGLCLADGVTTKPACDAFGLARTDVTGPWMGMTTVTSTLYFNAVAFLTSGWNSSSGTSFADWCAKINTDMNLNSIRHFVVSGTGTDNGNGTGHDYTTEQCVILFENGYEPAVQTFGSGSQGYSAMRLKSCNVSLEMLAPPGGPPSFDMAPTVAACASTPSAFMDPAGRWIASIPVSPGACLIVRETDAPVEDFCSASPFFYNMTTMFVPAKRWLAVGDTQESCESSCPTNPLVSKDSEECPPTTMHMCTSDFFGFSGGNDETMATDVAGCAKEVCKDSGTMSQLYGHMGGVEALVANVPGMRETTIPAEQCESTCDDSRYAMVPRGQVVSRTQEMKWTKIEPVADSTWGMALPMHYQDPGSFFGLMLSNRLIVDDFEQASQSEAMCSGGGNIMDGWSRSMIEGMNCACEGDQPVVSEMRRQSNSSDSSTDTNGTSVGNGLSSGNETSSNSSDGAANNTSNSSSNDDGSSESGSENDAAVVPKTKCEMLKAQPLIIATARLWASPSFRQPSDNNWPTLRTFFGSVYVHENAIRRSTMEALRGPMDESVGVQGRSLVMNATTVPLARVTPLAAKALSEGRAAVWSDYAVVKDSAGQVIGQVISPALGVVGLSNKTQTGETMICIWPDDSVIHNPTRFPTLDLSPVHPDTLSPLPPISATVQTSRDGSVCGYVPGGLTVPAVFLVRRTVDLKPYVPWTGEVVKAKMVLTGITRAGFTPARQDSFRVSVAQSLNDLGAGVSATDVVITSISDATGTTTFGNRRQAAGGSTVNYQVQANGVSAAALKDAVAKPTFASAFAAKMSAATGLTIGAVSQLIVQEAVPSITTTPAPTGTTTPETESGNITTNSTTPAPEGGGGLSGGEIAGIVIGSVAGAMILGFAGYFYMQSMQNQIPATGVEVEQTAYSARDVDVEAGGAAAVPNVPAASQRNVPGGQGEATPRNSWSKDDVEISMSPAGDPFVQQARDRYHEDRDPTEGYAGSPSQKAVSPGSIYPKVESGVV